MRRHFLFLFALLLSAQFVFALTLKDVTPASEIPSYYSSLDGKSGSSLYNTLNTITNNGFVSLGYDGLWEAYPYTDVFPTDPTHPDYVAGKGGKLWDMYGNCSFSATSTSDHCGNYDSECDCVNREHSIPKSWWGGGSNNMYSDIFHLVPTDGYVNNKRSNYAFGEVSNATYTYNECKLGSPKTVSTNKNTLLGTSATTSASPVFEPRDEYKGDFARGYLGMIAKYSNTTYSITSGDGGKIFEAFSSTTHYGLTQYGIVLLMKWHREDPVSQKEIDRNNGIQKTQGNRNPFIDYPYLAEYIWGEHAGEAVDMSKLISSSDADFEPGVSDGQRNTTTPAITSPKGTIALGSTNTTVSATYDMTVKGVNLTSGSLQLSLSGSSYFSLATYSVTKTQAEAGYNVTITYSPTAEGSHTATLTINGCGVTNHTVTLTGSCTAEHTITWSSVGLTQYTTAATGTIPPLPNQTPADCDENRVFMGWTETAGYSGDTEPSDLFTTPSAIDGPKTYYAVYADKQTTGSGGSSSTVSYTFTSKSWAATPSDWVSGKNGVGYINNGVQVTTGASGANATCPTSYDDISTIIVSYCTNASKGAGSIQMSVGSASVSNDVSTIGGTTPRNLSFDFSSTMPSGAPQISVTCTTNSIYICGVTITYGGSGSTTYSNYSTQCTACTPVAATASFTSSTKSTTCGGSVSNTFTTNSNATVTYTSSNENVATVDASTGVVTAVGAGTTIITATVQANTCFTPGKSASYTLNVTRTSPIASFVSPTTTLSEGATATNAVTTESDGVVTYSSSNESVATVDNNGVVTGVATGTTLITATVAQSDCYNTTSAQYNLAVTAAPQYTVTFKNNGVIYTTRTGPAQTIINDVDDPTACDGYTFHGWNSFTLANDNTLDITDYPGRILDKDTTYHAVYSHPEGESATTSLSMETLGATSGTIGGFTIATDKGSGSTNPSYNTTGKDLRIYAKGTITISSSTAMTSIVFNLSSQGKTRLSAISASEGTIAAQTSGDETVSWTGSATEVTFTVGEKATYGTDPTKAGQFCFTSIDVTTGSGATYYTTSPNCCTATITLVADPTAGGTVQFVE